MRKLLVASLLALPLGLGCQHTGGICDCAPVPGDSTGFNPHVSYHATCPGTEPPVKVVPVPTKPVSTSGGTSFEPIGPPNPMPSGKAKL